MEKLYIASKPVALGKEHLYIVYDPNGILDGDERILRGGPENNSFIAAFGNLIIEDGFEIGISEDRYNHPLGSGQSPEERNYTLIASNLDAALAWSKMLSWARSLEISKDENNRIIIDYDYDAYLDEGRLHNQIT